MTLRRLLTFLLFACIVHGASAAPASGDMAPDYLGKTLEDKELAVSHYRGKVLVVSFWATWCPYCLKELPILEGNQQTAGTDKVQVIAINTENRDVFRKVSRALSKLTLGMSYDPGKKSATLYGVNGIPHLLIIGRDGRIRNVYRGYDESSLDGIVESLNVAINMPVEAVDN